jgi:hypothetical protein
MLVTGRSNLYRFTLSAFSHVYLVNLIPNTINFLFVQLNPMLFDSPDDRITFDRLRELVSYIAGTLSDPGLSKGR